jgi:hypothetical protein
VSEVQAVQQKFPGVSLHQPRHAVSRWIARVYLNNGVRKAVPGRFDSAREAYDARVAFIELHGIVSKRKPRSVSSTVGAK